MSNSLLAEDQDKSLNILLIHTGHANNPWQMSVENGMRNALAASYSDFQIYSEQLDGLRFSSEQHRDTFAQFIQQKYSDSNIGFLVTEGIGAAQFVDDSAWLFPQAKRLYVNPGNQLELALRAREKPNSYIPVNQDYFNSLLAALQIYPTSKLVIIGETVTRSGSNRIKAVKQAILDIKLNDIALTVDFLVDLTMVELIHKVKQLNSKELIYYLPIHQDGDNLIVPYEAAERIAAVAAAPVFSNWEVLLGSGIVGGYLLSGDKVGEIAVASLDKLLHDQAIENTEQNGYAYYYDWMQLQRWGIDEDKLPANAIVRNRVPSFYQAYFWVINITLTALVLLMLLALQLERINLGRKQAITALSKERALLEKNVEIRTRDLNEAKKIAEALARTDPLTGVNNRRAFFEKANDAFIMSKRYSQALNVVMIDIDNFKSVNDQFGHAAGDLVIKAIADLVEEVRRQSDVFGRIGGEEFALVMPQTNLTQANLVAERIRLAIEKLELTFEKRPIRVTASFGIAEVVADDRDIADTMDKADKALFQAKQTGRNKVLQYFPPT